MFIYVVKQGDNLFLISTKYQVTMYSIRIYNGLATDKLVPGQDLLIPTNVYIVQPGDSLYLISQMSSIPVETLRIVNGLHSDMLVVGMQLYLPPRVKYKAVNLSYIIPTTPQENQIKVRRFAIINTFFGIFGYNITEDGNLSALGSLNDEELIRLLRNNNVAPLAVITNLTSAGFSSQITNEVLNSPVRTNNLINNIYNLLKSKNYAGVNIDFEQVQEDVRDLYSDFLRKLREKLKSEGYYTTVAVPAKTNDFTPWLKGYDYGGIGSAVDYVFIMAYDWHEKSSQPGPIAPINEVRQTIKYALNQMPATKILLGLPRYGYDWTMSNGEVIRATSLSSDSAVGTAITYEVPIQFSTIYQQPFFNYRDNEGFRHEVWFENARARSKKFQLVIDYGLAGFGTWQLGQLFIQSYNLINEYFIPQKV